MILLGPSYFTLLHCCARHSVNPVALLLMSVHLYVRKKIQDFFLSFCSILFACFSSKRGGVWLFLKDFLCPYMQLFSRLLQTLRYMIFQINSSFNEKLLSFPSTKLSTQFKQLSSLSYYCRKTFKCWLLNSYEQLKCWLSKLNVKIKCRSLKLTDQFKCWLLKFNVKIKCRSLNVNC